MLTVFYYNEIDKILICLSVHMIINKDCLSMRNIIYLTFLNFKTY